MHPQNLPAGKEEEHRQLSQNLPVMSLPLATLQQGLCTHFYCHHHRLVFLFLFFVYFSVSGLHRMDSGMLMHTLVSGFLFNVTLLRLRMLSCVVIEAVFSGLCNVTWREDTTINLPIHLPICLFINLPIHSTMPGIWVSPRDEQCFSGYSSTCPVTQIQVWNCSGKNQHILSFCRRCRIDQEVQLLPTFRT